MCMSGFTLCLPCSVIGPNYRTVCVSFPFLSFIFFIFPGARNTKTINVNVFSRAWHAHYWIGCLISRSRHSLLVGYMSLIRVLIGSLGYWCFLWLTRCQLVLWIALLLVVRTSLSYKNDRIVCFVPYHPAWSMYNSNSDNFNSVYG